jgi:lysophospholipase L1-like esterase
MNVMKNRSVKLFTIVAVNIIAILIIGEVMFRFFLTAKTPDVSDERNLTYRYHEELGWFPIENSLKEFKGSRLIHVRHNKDGFRDNDIGGKTKKRIAFIGDSFVWGFDVNADERFTEKLQKKIPTWEVLNMGVSGYGTDQEYILLKNWFKKYQPDIVVNLHCYNDHQDNSSNTSYGYYKPYFKIEDQQLTLKGTPVPKSINYYNKEYPILFMSHLIKGMFTLYIQKAAPEIAVPDTWEYLVLAAKKYVESNGAKFILAFESSREDGESCHFCDINRIPYVFLTNNYTYDSHGYHWTPAGHAFVTDKLYNFFQKNDYLKP